MPAAVPGDAGGRGGEGSEGPRGRERDGAVGCEGVEIVRTEEGVDVAKGGISKWCWKIRVMVDSLTT